MSHERPACKPYFCSWPLWYVTDFSSWIILVPKATKICTLILVSDFSGLLVWNPTFFQLPKLITVYCIYSSLNKRWSDQLKKKCLSQVTKSYILQNKTQVTPTFCSFLHCAKDRPMRPRRAQAAAGLHKKFWLEQNHLEKVHWTASI